MSFCKNCCCRKQECLEMGFDLEEGIISMGKPIGTWPKLIAQPPSEPTFKNCEYDIYYQQTFPETKRTVPFIIGVDKSLNAYLHKIYTRFEIWTEPMTSVDRLKGLSHAIGGAIMNSMDFRHFQRSFLCFPWSMGSKITIKLAFLH